MNGVTGFDLWFGCDVYQLFKFILIFLFHRLRVHAPPNADLQNHRRSFRFLRLSGTNAGKCHPTIHTGSTILWFYFSKNLFIINKQKQGLLLIDNAVGGGGDTKTDIYNEFKKNIRMVWNKIFKNVIKKNSHWHSNRYPKLNWKKKQPHKIEMLRIYSIYHYSLLSFSLAGGGAPVSPSLLVPGLPALSVRL